MSPSLGQQAGRLGLGPPAGSRPHGPEATVGGPSAGRGASSRGLAPGWRVAVSSGDAQRASLLSFRRHHGSAGIFTGIPGASRPRMKGSPFPRVGVASGSLHMRVGNSRAWGFLGAGSAATATRPAGHRAPAPGDLCACRLRHTGVPTLEGLRVPGHPEGLRDRGTTSATPGCVAHGTEPPSLPAVPGCLNEPVGATAGEESKAIPSVTLSGGTRSIVLRTNHFFL